MPKYDDTALNSLKELSTDSIDASIKGLQESMDELRASMSAIAEHHTMMQHARLDKISDTMFEGFCLHVEDSFKEGFAAGVNGKDHDEAVEDMCDTHRVAFTAGYHAGYQAVETIDGFQHRDDAPEVLQ